jgi:endonuclease III
MSTHVDEIVARVKALPSDEQLEVARAIDRLTWTKRWRSVCERIEQAGRSASLPSDEQIDQAVRQVRQERPLSERSSTRPS